MTGSSVERWTIESQLKRVSDLPMAERDQTTGSGLAFYSRPPSGRSVAELARYHHSRPNILDQALVERRPDVAGPGV